MDTTQATASDRTKVYINGNQITAFGTATYPTQNTDLFIKRPKTILIRLKSEYAGYFIPLTLNYPNFSKDKLDKIYKKIFFKNIISWLFLSIKYCGKKVTFKNIKKYRNIIKEPILIKITLIFFYVCPIFILDFIKIFRRNFIK
jgi:hypothetical protein